MPGTNDGDLPIPESEISLLNKLLNDKINHLNEGVLEISAQQKDPNSPLYSVKSFEQLNLKSDLIKALYLMGFQQPSRIQEAALPLLLSDPPRDIIAQSQSGTGKTAAFLLTILNRLNPEKNYPQCICLAPTLELAKQIGDVATKMAHFMPQIRIRFATKGEIIPRGTLFEEQIIIGTPGKLLDWLNKEHLDPAKIISFVLDEADIMISQQGYQDKSIRIHNIIVSANQNCQCMLFSATYSPAVFEFAEKMIADPTIITIRRTEQTLPNIRQYFIRCKNRDEKYKAIISLYSSLTIASSIIFCYTRSSSTWLAQRLKEKGCEVALLHGELPVDERSRIIQSFKMGKDKVLITTNVSSRGLDIPTVSLVVNYDPPVTYEENPQPDYDTYLHRIGRTGRFGKPGIAVNLVDSEIAMSIVSHFQEHFGQPIAELDAKNVDLIN